MRGGDKMIKVEALNTYEKLNVQDNELKRILKQGEVFEVSEERLSVLLGDNSYNMAFVKKLEEDEITEEVVQCVAEAIVDQADEENKSVGEVVSEIIEESKEDIEKKSKGSKK